MAGLFSKKLNKDIPVPYYYQLKEILLEYIVEKPDNNNQIPTEIELSEHFGISRPTVRQAINELVFEGYLTRQKGKGTFITKTKINQSFLQVLESFNHEMVRKGLTPTTKVIGLKVMEADSSIAEMLKIAVNDQVIQLRRLRFANDEPIVYVITYLPYEKCQAIMDKDFQRESLYDLLSKECGFELLKAVRKLEAVLAGEYESQILEIEKGTPIQFIKSVTYLADETPIEYSLAKYRGDRSQFTFELGIR
ncbi:GntR family transcriptional regulator [Paenibacillus paeoniae]|uniref:GntR family transcriptional regulator n=1 Tax=Paenibacillus paeoniae TaxID=2292705 RepID=A0A371P5J7_9BACL|nr:GntR family transcriptional regulator [Paenibacillus paeoniae]REK71211.1 GntR family transcriptional regulator [Paenibacillus paeoniae]